jgi:hypothetical protein
MGMGHSMSGRNRVLVNNAWHESVSEQPDPSLQNQSIPPQYGKHYGFDITTETDNDVPANSTETQVGPVAMTKEELIAEHRAGLRKLLFAMLKRENELRLSEEAQQAYTKVREVDPDGLPLIVHVTEQLQRRVVQEFGFVDGREEEGIEFLRSAQALFPGDKELLHQANYIKYNRLVLGDLRVGSAAPNVDLVQFSQTPTKNADSEVKSDSISTSESFQTVKLLDIAAETKQPLVVIAASYS